MALIDNKIDLSRWVSDEMIAGESGGDATSKRVRVLMKQCDQTIERLEALYKQYALGVELRAPAEIRDRLEQMMTALLHAPKSSPDFKFRFEMLHAKHQSYKDRWDRLMRDIESGKIKKVAGPQRDKKNYRV